MIFHQGLAAQTIDRVVPSAGNFADLLGMFVWGFLIIVVVGLAVYLARQFIKYRYRGEVHLRRQTDWGSGVPTSKILEGRAAYIRKKGINIFRIRYGFMPWQLIDIGKLPNPEYMVGNKVYFLQYNVGELVQARKVVDWQTEKIRIEPVDNTTKDAAKRELGAYANILTTQRISPQMLAIATMGFIIMTGIIVLYFVSQG